jgi:hypothetical protein
MGGLLFFIRMNNLIQLLKARADYSFVGGTFLTGVVNGARPFPFRYRSAAPAPTPPTVLLLLLHVLLLVPPPVMLLLLYRRSCQV